MTLLDPQNGRILLITTPHTYRTEAFTAAASKLGIEIEQAIDLPLDLAADWQVPLGVDFRDLAAATGAIVDYAQKRPFSAILAVDDSGTLLAAHASAALHLPHNDPDSALAARDKHKMRQMLSGAGINAPRFQLFHTNDDPHAIAAQVGYPCVVKPTTLSGSRGVIRANDPAELVAAVQRLARLIAPAGSPPQPFLVEAYIPGIEVALEGMVDNGRLTILALFDKPDPLEGPFFEETIYTTPSRLPEATQQAIADCTDKAAQALGLRTGPIHAELRLNDDGPWLVEIAGRSIGGLCSRVLQFGISAAQDNATLEELILRQAAGLGLPAAQRVGQAGGVMMIPIPKAGLLRRVDGLAAAAAVPLIESIEITAKLNYPLVPLPEGESYLGFIFARGDSPAAVEAALRQAHQQLHFAIEPQIVLQIV
ncbi:MAG: ATP-grasp domain-containing protein [Chloroflexota bacterium]